ncbi:hypothetical protein [Bradyrhizobium sp. AZCC 2289]|uniref:hypothetical protein n=1 Tax=Bradyrhizobium sp. AZCC 2289 TaxID=3117026 RepID=UPI002FF39A74
MSVQHYPLLREGERNQRRTVSHAIDVLAQDANFGGADVAEVRVGTLRLPSREQVGLLSVFFENEKLGKSFVVSLATSSEFTARCQGEEAARQFSIFELDGAKADNDNIVRLSDGTVLRAVEVIPAKLPLKPSGLDWRIVHHTISIVKAENRCYRSLREHAKPTCSDVPEEMLPEEKVIDCSALEGLELPSLKYLAQQIGQRDPSLKRLSRQKIADALRNFGMRIPASQPHQ